MVGENRSPAPMQNSCLFSLRYPYVFTCIPIIPIRNESSLASVFLASKGVYSWVGVGEGRIIRQRLRDQRKPYPLFRRTQEPPAPEFIFSASLFLPQCCCLPPAACHRLLPEAGTELCLGTLGGRGLSTITSWGWGRWRLRY